ncbi:hypothetical protein NDU88_003078 [Pleurodeles waltl]|uniref:Uncharacterized protein n=1 Tax=Pleurodeles waltl TaxID=8319 RepID=A0AAV7W2F8_PLEWA|nr:hypothetical protein NDU88_003078 [Pleurodeles waltl]
MPAQLPHIPLSHFTGACELSEHLEPGPGAPCGSTAGGAWGNERGSRGALLDPFVRVLTASAARGASGPSCGEKPETKVVERAREGQNQAAGCAEEIGGGAGREQRREPLSNAPQQGERYVLTHGPGAEEVDQRPPVVRRGRAAEGLRGAQGAQIEQHMEVLDCATASLGRGAPEDMPTPPQ